MHLHKNKTRALLITHFAIRLDQGPAAPAFLHYLRKHTRKVAYIEHPFPYAPIQYSFLTIYENGEIKKSIKVSNIKGPAFLQFIYHFLLTHYFFLRAGPFFDVCISCESLSLISVMMYRKLGLIKRIIYNSMDYMEHRFKNALLNHIYHSIDRLACKTSDVNWVGTKQQIIARKNIGFNLKNYAKFEVIPNTYINEEIEILPAEKVNFYQLVFIGGVFKTIGLDLVINTLQRLVKKFPQIRLVIIGKGEYEIILKKLVKKLKLQKYVKFLGFIEKFKDATKIISSSSIGMATFLPEPDSLSYYSDPSKVRLYLACGLPVITTTVSTIGPLLIKKNAGIVIPYNENGLFRAISFMLSNQKRYVSFKKSAINLAKKFDLSFILDRAIRKL